jgi:hypothetical protein
MGILDDLSRGANKIANQISTGIDDTQARYRAEHLLYDYGLLVFSEQAGRPLPDSVAERERIWSELHELLGRSPAMVLRQKSTPAPPPPAPPAGQPPPAPPAS